MNLAPTNKVTAGAVAGGAVAVIIWAVKQFGGGVELSPEAAVGLTAIFTAIVQYFVPDAPKEV